MQNNLCENENYTVPHEKNEGRCSKIGYVPLNSIADSKKLTISRCSMHQLHPISEHRPLFFEESCAKKNEEI